MSTNVVKISFPFFIFIVFFLFHNKNAYGQDALKNVFNEMIESSRQKQKPGDSTRNNHATLDSTSVADKNTDANAAAESETGETAETATDTPVDTASFVNRVSNAKTRYSVKDLGDEKEWSQYYLITNNQVYKKEHTLDKNFKVFGWHPHWMGSAYKSYNFSLLSAVAYFSYELNPQTGKYNTIHDWMKTSLVDSAQKHNCKVLLTVTNFGAANNNAFLSNSRAQKVFINTLISLLKERNADGVNIDFEGISAVNKRQLTNFIIDLTTSMRSERPDYWITLALPPIDFKNIYEVEQLNQYIDLFIIMGYEFYGVNSKHAGPVAPLSSGKIWWPYNLQTVVDEYLVSGIPAPKLLLGLPYYGAEWQTEDLKFPSKATKFINYPMYRNIKNKHGNLPCCEDKNSGSKFYVYRNDEGQYQQLWYEDSLSLSKKYDWIKNKKIGGLGIWALGYDNGYTELWELLAAKFAVSEKMVKAASVKTGWGALSWRRMVNMAFRLLKDPNYLFKNPRPLFSIFGALMGVSMVGFFVLYRYGFRLKRMFNIALKGTIALLIIMILALIFIAMKYTGTKEMAFLIAGFLIGAIIIFFVSRHFLSEKDLP